MVSTFFFFFSLTDLMKVQWGIHLGRCSKLGSGGSSGRVRPPLSCPHLLESKSQAREGLASQTWAVESPPGCRLGSRPAKLRKARAPQRWRWQVAICGPRGYSLGMPVLTHTQAQKAPLVKAMAGWSCNANGSILRFRP